MKRIRVFAVRKEPEKEFDGEAKWSFHQRLKEALNNEIQLLVAKSYCRPMGLLHAIEDGDYVTIYQPSSRGDNIKVVEVNGQFRDYLASHSNFSSYSCIKDYEN